MAKQNEGKKASIESAKREKKERKQNLIAKAKDIKQALISNQSLFVLLCKKVLVIPNELDNLLPSSVLSLYENSKMCFPRRSLMDYHL